MMEFALRRKIWHFGMSSPPMKQACGMQCSGRKGWDGLPQRIAATRGANFNPRSDTKRRGPCKMNSHAQSLGPSPKYSPRPRHSACKPWPRKANQLREQTLRNLGQLLTKQTFFVTPLCNRKMTPRPANLKTWIRNPRGQQVIQTWDIVPHKRHIKPS